MDNTQPRLTPQEKKILYLVSLRKKNKEIGEELFISPHTVKNHKANVIRKLNLKSNAELLVYTFFNL
jgi:DNA-binding CsgD family transcriptional regulator